MMKNSICILLLLLSGTLWGNNTERITRFHSDIVIDTTGRVEVTEKIRVFANGEQIQRGIIRSIPIYRKDKYGNSKKMDIRILSVLCNRKSENYKTENSGDYKKVYIGNNDVYLEPGIYEYIITYESYGHIGFFDTFDELYWNVTGNEWDFYIEKASATIILPENSFPLNTACYTGASGSTDTNCSVQENGNTVTFQTTEPLSYHEGFTIALSFPCNIVKRPPPPTQAELFWEKHKELICAIVSLLIIGIYYLLTWLKVGKDPEKHVIIPHFKSPHNWSPAILRYLFKKGYDDKIVTASLVDMAVKRVIRIEQQLKQYSLQATRDNTLLSNEEKEIYSALFSGKKTITVSDTNHQKFVNANTQLEKSIKKQLNIKDYYLKNIKYIVFAALITLALFILNLIFTRSETLLIALFMMPFALTGIFFFISGIRQRSCSGILFVIIGFVFCAPLPFILIHEFKGNTVTTLFFMGMLILFTLYVYLIKAPTELGAKTQAEIDGFRLYLKTAEENRLNLLTPPERTPELFEKLLPFAIALDVENEWSKKFNDVLKQTNYQPEWYHGDKAFVTAGFAGSFSNSFSSSVKNAQVDPTSSSSSGSSGSSSWSSGSSGGGSSGGGGGGGGGGGW